MNKQTTYVFDLRSEANLMPFGEPNEELRHNTLNDRDIEDQHTIEAITGLRDELDGIHALKTVKADKRHFADYYLWDDKNVHKENRIGKFVTICSELYTIAVCTADDDICGVIVDSAGFVGNDDKFGRNEEYALVATTGVVDVQCESSTQVGDCVVSNEYGIAKATTSKYGYTVLALKNVDGMSCATISLGAPISHIPRISQDVLDIDRRVRAAEANAVSAMNAVNNTNNQVDKIYEAIVNASQKNDDSMANMSDILDATLNDATEAKQIVDQLKIDVEKSTAETLEAVANAVDGVNTLTSELDPILSFTDDDENVGPVYMARYLKNDVATKQEVFTLENGMNEKISSFKQTAEGFEMLVSSVDKWSVGDYAPSCGLTIEQAQEIINDDMVYVPTNSHVESFNNADKHFVKSYYYIWKTNYWEEHTYPAVIFSSELPSGVAGQFWYTDSKNAPTGYEAKALYQFNNNKWNKIAMLNGNANNRTTSLIQQTANEIKASVSSTQGSVAGLTAKVNGLETSIETVAKWSKGGRDAGYTLAAIDQSADQDGATLTLMVANEDGAKEISGASIVLGANDESYFAVNADRVDFTAGTFTIDANHLNLNGATTLNDNVTIGTDGKITAVNANISGVITATSGNFTNCTIDDTCTIQGKLTIGNLPDGVATEENIPTSTSQLINDSGYQNATQVTEITNETIKTTNVLANNLQVNATHIQGTLVIGQLPDNVAETSDIPTNISQLTNDSGYQNAEDVVTIAKGEISAAKIRANQIDVTDLNAFGATIGGWTINNDGILSGTYINSKNFVEGKTISGMISANEPKEDTVNGDHCITNFNYKSLVDTTSDSNIRFIAGCTPVYYPENQSDAYISLTDSAKFMVLEDGSLYANAVDITGTIHATDGEFNGAIHASSGDIGNLKIIDGGLQSPTSVGNFPYNFILNSRGFQIYSDAKIQVGNICLTSDYNYSYVSAQGQVSLQSGPIDNPTSYIRFGGANATGSAQQHEANITLHAEAIGTGNEQSVKFYAQSSVELPVVKYVTFYYSTAIFGRAYPTEMAEINGVTLLIAAGNTHSEEYFVNNGSSIINRWIRFSTNTEKMKTALDAGKGTNTTEMAEICMNTSGNTTSAQISCGSFVWSSSSNDFLINGNLVLDKYKTGNLGDSDSRWSAVFANSIDTLTSTTSLAYTDSGTIDSSDRNIKKDIESIPDAYSALFDSLTPVRYKYIDNTSDRYHTGFIAQDVLTATENAGLTPQDFAAYCKWTKENGESICGLRYSELIALCVHEIQKLKKRVSELENK